MRRNTRLCPVSSNAPRLRGVALVTDERVREAMRVAFAEFGLIAEPGGVAALAAILAGKVSIEGRCVAVALTGTNVNSAAFGAAIS